MQTGAIAFAVTVTANARNGQILNLDSNHFPFFIGANISKLHTVYKVIFLAYFFFNLSVLRVDEEIILTPQEIYLKKTYLY